MRSNKHTWMTQNHCLTPQYNTHPQSYREQKQEQSRMITPHTPLASTRTTISNKWESTIPQQQRLHPVFQQ